MTASNVLTTAKRIRRQASKGYRHEQLQLLTAVTASDAMLTMTTVLPRGLIAGATLAIDTEMMLVMSVNTGANTVTVIRGYLDTTAATAVAGALVDVNPRFSLLDIVDAMRNEISSWGAKLYQVVNTELAASVSATTAELPVSWQGMLGVVEVVQSELGGDYTVWPRLPCKLIRGDTGAGFSGAPTSGLLLRFKEPIRTGAVFVTAAMPFDVSTLDNTTDLIADIGITQGMMDVLEMGCKRRVMADELIGKGARHAQDESRRAEETPVGSLVPVSQLQNALYMRRLSEEAGLLHRAYPIVIT